LIPNDNLPSLLDKIDSIEKFNIILDKIIANKPSPDTLNPKLVKYIGYDNFYTTKEKDIIDI
jgi:hypothetical protein